MQKRKIPAALMWLIYLFIYAVLSYVMGSSVQSVLDNLLDFVLPLLLSVILALFIHEFGYMLFARLTGYRFLSFRVRSYILISGKHGLSIKRQHFRSEPVEASMVPPQAEDGEYPYRLALRGGMIFNLLAAAVTAILYLTVLPSSFFELFATVNLAILLIERFPSFHFLPRRDHLKLMKSSSVFRHLEWLYIKIMASFAQGTQLKSLPEEWFNIPEYTDQDIEYVNFLRFYQAERELDRLNISAAVDVLSEISMESASMFIRSSLKSFQLFCNLIEDPTLPQLKQDWEDEELQKYLKYLPGHPGTLRKEYAYALLHEGDVNKASEYRAAFDQAAEQSPYPGEIAGEYALMELVDKRYQELKASK